MSVRNVYHKTRDRVYKMNFSATGETSWSFIAEADGEVYAVDSNNVASYSINGASITLPFSLTAGSSYAVSITKITSGQVADITFKSRRETEKFTSQNVPDFGAYDGRYLYVLFDSPNEVKKIDTDLLTSSNYLGSGSWTTDPVVATISLPTLPDSTLYKSITFVKNGGEGKMFIQGITPNSFNVYTSYIKNDDIVYDMDEVTPGGYTQINSSSLIYNPGINAVYDYINEIVYFPTGIGTNGFNGIAYNLVTKERFQLGYEGFVSNVMGSTSIRQFQFIPNLERWSHAYDMSFVLERSYNYKNPQNSSGKACYIQSLGMVAMQVNALGWVSLFDSYGNKQGSINYGTVGVYGVTEMVCFDSLSTIFVVRSTNSKGALINYDIGNTVFIDGVGIKSIMASNRNNLFFAITNTNRLSVYSHNESAPLLGYIEFLNTPNQIHSNQLIV